MSCSEPFHNTFIYASTANIEEVMKFYNLGDKTFKTDFNNPGKLIISGCDSPSPNYILGALLKTNCPNIPSYIKDTNDFLQTVLHSDLNIPPNSIPLTIDGQSSAQTFHKMKELTFAYQV